MSAPARVRHTCRALYRGTGIPATVTVDGRDWRVELNAGRVVMVGWFKRAGGGELTWSDSYLEIDGDRVLNAEGVEHLAQIIADPDPHKLIVLDDLDTVVAELVPAGVEEAPASLRHFWSGIVPHRPEGGDLILGRHRGRWMVVMALGDRRLVMTWELRHGDWVRPADFLRVQVGDETLVVPESDVDRAIAMVLGEGYSPTPKSPPPNSIRKPTASTRSNAVETRRATVIRN